MLHLLIVAAMLSLFGIVLPSHAPMHALADACGHAEHSSRDDGSGGGRGTHHKQACPICQVASHLSSAPPAMAVCTMAPAAVEVVLPAPQRLDSVQPRAPYHGRAPPLV